MSNERTPRRPDAAPVDIHEVGSLSGVPRVELLTELIARTIDGVVESNEAHVGFVHQMREDAVVFAAQMRHASARTDMAVDIVEVSPGGFFREAQYRYDSYPIWIIRGNERYGGSTMVNDVHTSYAHTPITRYRRNFICIQQTGDLVICTSRDAKNRNFHINPNRTYEASSFVDRVVSDDAKLFDRVREEWLTDLEAAAEKYTKR